MNIAVITKSPEKAKLPRLRDEFSDWMRMKNYRENTIRDYVADVLDFVMYSGKRDPRTLGPADVQKFLTMLAVKRNVSWKTQNQNLCALVKFYDGFLNQPLDA